MSKSIPLFAGSLIFCLICSWLAFRLFADGFFVLGIFLSLAVIFILFVTLRNSLSPWRWLAPGLVMAALFTIYPILYTFYLSFTNMGGGHLLTKTQAVRRLSEEMYRPDDGGSWSWTAYRKGKDFLLLLNNDGEYSIVKHGSLPETVDIKTAPPEINGYVLMTRGETLQNLQVLGEIDFGKPPQVIKVLSMQEVAVQLPVYSYDIDKNMFTDNRDGEIYRSVRGTYTSESGNTLTPGYMVFVGMSNYIRFLGNTGFLKPVFGILVWNISFSLLSVLISFAVGLMIALLFDDLKFRRIIRTILIIPYPIPVLVSIMVWRALLNDNMGLVTTIITNIFGSSPRFFTNVGWTRFALIMINVYLSYPYFYVLSSGALKSIPGELFEAAAIDGANTFTVIKRIILPMVMRILAPLLIASFTFNFNNFTLIWGFNMGQPAIADAAVPMGYTDLLISFIYRLGFGTSNAPDYGFTAAITVMLFIVVSMMVFFQALNTQAIKETR